MCALQRYFCFPNLEGFCWFDVRAAPINLAEIKNRRIWITSTTMLTINNACNLVWNHRNHRWTVEAQKLDQDTRMSPNSKCYFLPLVIDLALFPCLRTISLMPRPHRERGSGDIRLIPRASLKIHNLLMHSWELITNFPRLHNVLLIVQILCRILYWK